MGLLGKFGRFLAACARGSFLSADFRLWRSRPRRKRGNSAVAAALSGLPDDYVLLSDLAFPGCRGGIDYFLIGPNGLFAIESRDDSGHVKCEGFEWYVDGRRIPSPARRTKHNAAAVRNGLSALGMKTRPVAVIVFTDPAVTLKLYETAVPVVRLDELAGLIRNYPAAGAVLPEEVRTIARQVQSLKSTAPARAPA